jgi:CshA-type fibril repeat protein
VTYGLAAGSLPSPTDLVFTGVLHCAVQGDTSWHATLPAGQTTFTTLVVPAWAGDQCTFAADGLPAAPAGYSWSGGLTAAGTTVDPVGEAHAATYTAALTAPGPTAPPASATTNPGVAAILSPTVTPGTGTLAGVSFDNGQPTKVVPGEGTWTISMVSGTVSAVFAPLAGYTGTVTPQSYVVTDSLGLSASNTLSVVINQPPSAGSASAQGPSGTPLTLTPTVTAGTGSLVSASFSNGHDTLVVAGEGSWSLALSDGKVVAVFTPETGFTGTATPQPYFVANSLGLSATGLLTATITKSSTSGSGDGLASTGAVVSAGQMAWTGAALAAGFILLALRGRRRRS